MFEDPSLVIEMQLCGLADEDGNPIDCETEQHQKTVIEDK